MEQENKIETYDSLETKIADASEIVDENGNPVVIDDTIESLNDGKTYTKEEFLKMFPNYYEDLKKLKNKGLRPKHFKQVSLEHGRNRKQKRKEARAARKRNRGK